MIEDWVLHVDLDQFLAAVEVLRHPELAGRPVVVGGDGDPTKRGVVSTASYEARAHGVGSGMPLRLAARKSPDAVFLPVDRPAYDAASAVVMTTLRGLEWGGRPVVVEVLGWDECFLAAGPRPGEEHDDPRCVVRRARPALGRGRRTGTGRGRGPRADGIGGVGGVGPDAVRHPPARPRPGRDRTALLGRHRRQQAAGEDRDRVRQAARQLRAHRGELVRGDGRAAHDGAVGHRLEDRQEAGRTRASTRCSSWP